MYSKINSFISVVIPAGGKGTRMGLKLNKQYMEVLGKPVLARTIEAFEACSRINEIVIAVSDDETNYCKKNIIEKFGYKKVKAVVAGGESRQQSVFNGLLSISDRCDIVLIHDGARPFIDKAGIYRCIDAAGEYGSACAAVPVKDTIKRAGDGDFVTETVDRSSLWSIQTPQAFRHELIINAHRRAVNEGFAATDDAMLAERLGHKVKLVICSYYNIKITTKEDLVFAESIARMLDKNYMKGLTE